MKAHTNKRSLSKNAAVVKYHKFVALTKQMAAKSNEADARKMQDLMEFDGFESIGDPTENPTEVAAIALYAELLELAKSVLKDDAKRAPCDKICFLHPSISTRTREIGVLLNELDPDYLAGFMGSFECFLRSLDLSELAMVWNGIGDFWA
jgi:hypothetical protein